MSEFAEAPEVQPPTSIPHRHKIIAWKAGLYLSPFAFSLVLLLWGKYFTAFWVIAFCLLVVSLFGIALFFHVKGSGGLENYVRKNLRSSFAAIFLFFCFIFGTAFYLVRRPPPVSSSTPNQAASHSPEIKSSTVPPISVAPTITNSPVGPKLTISPTVKPPPKEQRPGKSSSPRVPDPASQNPEPGSSTESTPPAPSTTQPSNVGCIGGTGNACAGTVQPGGVLVGTLGDVPPPDRVIQPNDEDSAINLLKTVPPGKMAYFIKIPNDSPENSEISRFQLSLENVFGRGGWVPWQDRETHIDSYTTMGEGYTSHGEGIGCTPAKGHKEEAAVAMKALAILKHPCRGRSANDFESYPQHGDFVIYISIGTRLPRKE